MKELKPSERDWADMSRAAWAARRNAAILKDNDTRVGCAIQTVGAQAFDLGCNVEHPFLTQTIHAETNAIGNMIVRTGPDAKIKRILVVAERHKFTPCGGCMDMIMQYSEAECLVAYQNDPDGPIRCYTRNELMPEYPC